MEVEIPANTTATVFIPADDEADILEGGKPLSLVKDIQITGKETGYVVMKVGSGKYHFTRK